MNIGLLGGSFNPVHLGHVQMAEAVRDEFLLDELILIVSAAPPHKDASEMAPATDRLEMTRLAFASVFGCRVSDIELRRAGPSYTIDTVTHFQSILPLSEHASLYLIMGLDCFLELNTWKDYLLLLTKLSLIVVCRPATAINQLQAMENFLAADVSTAYVFSKKRSCFYHPCRPPVFFFSRINVPVSSTQIRSRIKEGCSVNHLLPEAVARVIYKKGLYR